MAIYYQIMWGLVVLSACEILCMCKKLVFTMKLRDKEIRIDADRIISVIVGIVLFVIAANRSQEVGRDLVNYIPRFKSIAVASSWGELKSLANAYSFEIGFVVFCKILSFFSVKAHFFISITSALVGIGFYVITKYSRMPLTTWMMIYCFGMWGSSLNVIRQFIALMILSISIKYIEKRNIWKFFLLILVAMTIHSSSILFVFMYLFNIKQINSKFIHRFIIICAFMVVYGNQIIEIIINRTSFAWYLHRMDGSGQSTLILLITIFIGAYIYKDSIISIDSKANIWFGAIVMAIILNILALKCGILARAMKFFLPFVMVLLTDFMYSHRKNKILFLCIGSFLIIFFVLYFNVIIIGKTALPEGWQLYKSIGVN